MILKATDVLEKCVLLMVYVPALKGSDLLSVENELTSDDESQEGGIP